MKNNSENMEDNILSERIFNERKCNTLQDLEDQDNEVNLLSSIIIVFISSRIEYLEKNLIDPSNLILLPDDFNSKSCNLLKVMGKIIKLTGITYSNLIVALCYIDSFFIDRKNIKKLLLISLMVTTKFYEDYHYNNEHWAFVGGLELEVINSLEKIFLILKDYKLKLDEKTFNLKREEISKCALL